MNYQIKQSLMIRDGLTEAEALAQIEEAIAPYLDGELTYDSLEDLLRDEFGLEPDYLMDLLNYIDV